MEQNINNKRSADLTFKMLAEWIQTDLQSDRKAMNKKILNVVLWCLGYPTLLVVLLLLIRRLNFFYLDRYFDYIVFFPPAIYIIISIWPMLREVPTVFKKGGISAHLDETTQEIKWREARTSKMIQDLKLNPLEWQQIQFHLKNEIERFREQNRYMTILTGSVLFLLFQFLDLGNPDPAFVYSKNPQSLAAFWVNQFSQWSVQVFSLIIFVVLFYLSGTQSQRILSRYLVCIDKIVLDFKEN